MSYVNMIMYSAVLPSYKGRNKGKEDDDVINADDPKNRDMVMKFFAGID